MTPKRKGFHINETTVAPGGRKTIDIPVAHLHTHTEMTMPVHVIHGRKEGPTLFVSAAVHGDEILGVEIIRRLVQYKKLRQIQGTLLAVPVVNVYGFIHHSRYLPDRRDLNRFFPGSEKGSLASRLAHIFTTKIVENCTHGIDIHTGSNHRINLPHIRARLDEPETQQLAEAFGAPVIIDANVRDGSLRQGVMEKGIPVLLFEAGEALRFDELAIRTGLSGILSVMGRIGMLSIRNTPKRKTKSLIAKTSIWARAPSSGILRTTKMLGQTVDKDDPMGVISDPFGENTEIVTAPESGIIIGRLNIPLVHEGDAIFHIARLDHDAPVEAALQEYQEQSDSVKMDDLDLI